MEAAKGAKEGGKGEIQYRSAGGVGEWAKGSLNGGLLKGTRPESERTGETSVEERSWLLQARSHTYNEASPSTNLARCCLVSSTFRRLATPLLFRHLSVVLQERRRRKRDASDSDDELPTTNFATTDFARRDTPTLPLHHINALIAARHELRYHPRTLTIVDQPRNVSESKGQATFDEVQVLLHGLPFLRSLELPDMRWAEPHGCIVDSLPRMPFGTTLQRITVRSSSLSREGATALDVALRSLRELQDLDLSFAGAEFRSEPWPSSAQGPFQLQLTRLALEYEAIPLLSGIASSSTAATLRHLTLEFRDAGRRSLLRLPPSFSLAQLQALQVLVLGGPSSDELDSVLDQISTLAALRHFTIRSEVSTYATIILNLGARLPPCLRILTLNFFILSEAADALYLDPRLSSCDLHLPKVKTEPSLAQQLAAERRERHHESWGGSREGFGAAGSEQRRRRF